MGEPWGLVGQKFLACRGCGRHRRAADAPLSRPLRCARARLNGVASGFRHPQSGLARSARGGLTCGWNGPGRTWLAALAARPGRSSTALLCGYIQTRFGLGENKVMIDSENGLFNEEIIESSKSLAILLEQYKLYVELTDKISERRQTVNTFFLSLNSILITGLMIFLTQVGGAQTNCIWILIAIVTGIVACATWRRLIRSYGELNAGRFQVIHLLESRLPARLFDFEWKILEQGKRYKPFTRTEVNVPLVFITMYVLIAVCVVVQAFLL